MQSLPNDLNAEKSLHFSTIIDFLQQREKDTFILNGYAGTGKTYFMQQLATWLNDQGADIRLLASTGRAATVLRGKTGLEANTVHGELYRFSHVKGDHDELTEASSTDAFGQMLLQFSLRSADEERCLYIVDEASMIGSEDTGDSSHANFGSGRLLIDFFDAIKDNKVIFVGDPCQLPPVGQTTSPALDMQWLTRVAKRRPTQITLRQVVRTKKDSSILQVATKVRSYFNRTDLPNWVKLPVSGQKDVHVLPSYERLLKHYLDTIKDEPHEQRSIAICRTNADCSQINHVVRSYLYGRHNAPLQVGDLLLVTQNNYLVPLSNGDFVVVTEIGEKRRKMGIEFQHVRVKAKLTGVEHPILLATDVLYGKQANLSREQFRLLMIDFSKRMSNKRFKKNSKPYKDALMKDEFLNSLRATFGYAVTCHKAQGGEWPIVHLFLNKSMYVLQYPGLFHWWYTAITRAKEKLYLHQDWWIA